MKGEKGVVDGDSTRQACLGMKVEVDAGVQDTKPFLETSSYTSSTSSEPANDAVESTEKRSQAPNYPDSSVPLLESNEDRELPAESCGSSTTVSTESSSTDVPFQIKEELDPVYVCEECGVTLEDEEELKEHVVTSHLPSATKRSQATEAGVNGDVICHTCGLRFSCLKQFRKHFKSEHFVVEETRVEEPLEIPAFASSELVAKIERVIALMAARRRARPDLFQPRIRRTFMKTIATAEIITMLKDIGAMLRKECPVGE